jgi:hypothetical protein
MAGTSPAMTAGFLSGKFNKAEIAEVIDQTKRFSSSANQERSAPAEPKIRTAQLPDLSAQFFML